jgi:hypothetical protein
MEWFLKPNTILIFFPSTLSPLKFEGMLGSLAGAYKKSRSPSLFAFLARLSWGLYFPGFSLLT